MSDGVFCSCGAAWFGQYRAAAQAHIHRGCEQVSHVVYKKAFKCRCSECAAERKLARQGKRGSMPTVAEMEEALREHDLTALTAIVQRIVAIRKKP